MTQTNSVSTFKFSSPFRLASITCGTNSLSKQGKGMKGKTLVCSWRAAAAPLSCPPPYSCCPGGWHCAVSLQFQDGPRGRCESPAGSQAHVPMAAGAQVTRKWARRVSDAAGACLGCHAQEASFPSSGSILTTGNSASFSKAKQNIFFYILGQVSIPELLILNSPQTHSSHRLVNSLNEKHPF